MRPHVMPSFTTDGPAIPIEVLQILADGGLVFFCGAGVSTPAGLPSPPALVVPGPAPADAPACDDAPQDLQACAAPERPLERRLHPYAAPFLRHPSVGAGGVVAPHPSTPRA